MKSAIFITSGIGNALLLVPLMKELRKRGSLTCLASSPFHSELIFEGFEKDMFDEVIDISTSVKATRTAMRHPKAFDVAFLDYFAGGRKNLALARTISERVITNHPADKVPGLLQKGIEFIAPQHGIHEGLQYLKFISPQASMKDLNEDAFRLQAKTPEAFQHRAYITIQLGAGNNLTPWKTWPLEHWLEFMSALLVGHENLEIIVLGDDSEQWMTKLIPKDPRLQCLIGITELKEIPGIINGAQLHIGGDSGLLHIAGCLGVKTLTIWGGSDPGHFGWGSINPKKHSELPASKPACHPCNRWIAPNRSRVTEPGKCPDFKCIRGVGTEEVIATASQMLRDAQ